MPGDTELLHATAVAAAGRAALLVGPSGCGKSDLALRLATSAFRLGNGWVEPRLVADDQVLVSRRGSRLVAGAPERIAGLLEVRGVGIIRIEHMAEAELALVVDLSPDAAIKRLPEADARRTVLSISLPLLRVRAFEASAPAKVALCLAGVAAEHDGGSDASLGL